MGTRETPRRMLVLVRHATAEETAPSDAERPLTARGRAAAADVGAWLADLGTRPDHALVSAAVRTVQTWSAIAGAAGWELEPEVDRGLYSAGPETVIDLLRVLPDDVRTAVVVGHNPTMASLVQLLDDGEGDTGAADELAVGYPPAATTVLALDGSWADLAPAGASVTAFHVGRG